MPAALPVPLRERMVQLHEQRHLLTEIAQQLELRSATGRTGWRRYHKEGTAGLVPR